MAYGIRICVPYYVAAHEDAQRRIDLGQKQRQLKNCDRWHWHGEKCTHQPKKRKS